MIPVKKPCRVEVLIERFYGNSIGQRRVIIDCRDADHAEAVGKILTAQAEKEKEIALNAQESKHV
jgi:hypothetical protein